ncbi:MAG: methionine adenosyltransferase [Phycisphaeraceae bacterium]|nr:methionine adenosyltransferase [Phycisphaeraceae bacterium]
MQRTAEHVSDGHPDKFCDQVADRILDRALELCGDDTPQRNALRTAIECLAKDNLLIISGETKWSPDILKQMDIVELAREVWAEIGYSADGEDLTVINHIRSQSPHIAQGSGTGVDQGGAGDQGIMVGYATDETDEMMPREWVFSRNICRTLRDLRRDSTLGWLRADTKAQVTIDPEGRPIAFIVAAQHDPPEQCGISHDQMREKIFEQVVQPILGDGVPRELTKINGTGYFVIGGPTGDAGVVGRKIVVDAYGPRVPVGGGAYSGKDPTKVDRSAAYMARHIAKSIVASKVRDATEALVHIAYGIGQLQPEMVTAVTQTGEDVSDWVRQRFPDLSPGYIIESLGLRRPSGWGYTDTASYGHYGDDMFPWESVAGD